MNNLNDGLTDIWTTQDLSKQVGNIYTSWQPANSDLATGHCFMNGVAEYRKMLLLESRFRNGNTFDHHIIFYIYVSGSLESNAKHP